MENPNGAVNGNSQNNPTANVPRTRSTFPLQYHMFDTHRFGEYHPHYVEDGVKEDDLPIRSSHNVMSYTLKSPLMQDITLTKDYFLVPMEAILPLNWTKFFDNPVRGDDVLVNVGATVEAFWKITGEAYSRMVTAVTNILNTPNLSLNDYLQSYLRFLIIGEYIYSNGSLMSSLGCHGAPYINLVDGQNKKCSYDSFFDNAINVIVGAFTRSQETFFFEFSVDGISYSVGDETAIVNYNHQISMRHALSLMRDNPNFIITNVNPLNDNLLTNMTGCVTAYTISPVLASDVPFNLSRLWAYQLCCAHYYSNDHIDFVYDAQLFRQLVGNYVNLFGSNIFGSQMFFTYNGVKYQYDYLSAKVYDLLVNNHIVSWWETFLRNVTLTNGYAGVAGYFSALFAYRRSLRYQDYFTGSRAHPLAVGSTGVQVTGNMVDVVDVTRNIQRQRFLNAVNRVRHNFEGYLQGIFGGDVPAPDYHNPFFLASTSDTVYGQETENTAGAQMSNPIAITTNLRSNGARYMIEVHCDRPCVVLGITHYDIPRVYTKTMEREFLWKDRFDYFNPFMQFIGDQPVYIQELGINPTGSNLLNLANFAYTLRHMEFKQRFNQCAGGFIENLPGFAFLASDERGSQSTINPDWIRSVPSEFDNFYVSLTGYSNGSYWHFILDNYNDCSGSRPMAYAPSIL